jgi:hypothetical protein
VIKFNNKCAKAGDKVIVRYELGRHKGKFGTVKERAEHEIDERNKRFKYRSSHLVTIKFNDGAVAYNVEQINNIGINNSFLIIVDSQLNLYMLFR